MELGTAFGLGESLLLTALGGIIATSATLLATRMQAKEAARMRAEQFDRDDKFRLHKERVEVYVHFRVEIGHARDVLLNFTGQPAQLAHEARQTRDAVFRAAMPIYLFGHEQINDVVREILNYLDAILDGTDHMDTAKWSDLVLKYTTVTRSLLIGELRPTTSTTSRRLDPTGG